MILLTKDHFDNELDFVGMVIQSLIDCKEADEADDDVEVDIDAPNKVFDLFLLQTDTDVDADDYFSEEGYSFLLGTQVALDWNLALFLKY